MISTRTSSADSSRQTADASALAQVAPRAHKERAREGGQALVEFALVVPLLLLLIMGIIQFGMVFKDYLALVDATRIGGRQASVARSILPEQARIASVEQSVRRAAVNLDPSKLTISVEVWDPNTNQPVWAPAGNVTVSTTYPFEIDLFGLVRIAQGTLRSSVTERVE
ncbi:MAG: pilus assembly protein [Thermoleophilia bacterium]|nr:pilus assembly protein [Gaiellaceae bacterium]MDW8338611.1 pilus assembly protein [Thermoleophilia bacterium]